GSGITEHGILAHMSRHWNGLKDRDRGCTMSRRRCEVSKFFIIGIGNRRRESIKRDITRTLNLGIRVVNCMTTKDRTGPLNRHLWCYGVSWTHRWLGELNTASMDSYRNVLWQDVRGEVSGSWQALRRYHVDTPGLLNSHVYVRVGTHVLSCCLEVRGRGPAHV